MARRCRGGYHLGQRARGITARQIEVLKSRFQHGSRKEGAAALGISDRTARWHLVRLCERLGVDTAEQAAYVLWLRDLWSEPALMGA